MSENGITVEQPQPRQNGAPLRQPSRLEILTAANVEPALRAMLSSLEKLDERARMVLERDGSVLAAGRGLEHWLERSGCLALVDDRLRSVGREGQLKLETLLAVATGEVETVILARGGTTSGHCILRAAGLCKEALAVTMQIADEEFEPKLADLHEAFGLTPSEMHIVEMLQQGLGANEIGEQLAISVHTVRAHLRHCYDKLGVSSREELWQRLAPYRLN